MRFCHNSDYSFSPPKNRELEILGQSEWQEFFTRWGQYGCDTRHGIAVGCGAGRPTRCIRKLLTKLWLLIPPKTTYRTTDGFSFLPVSESEMVESKVYVFQHIESLAGVKRVMRAAHRELPPTGTIMFYMPIYSLLQSPLQSLSRSTITASKQAADEKVAIKTKLSEDHRVRAGLRMNMASRATRRD